MRTARKKKFKKRGGLAQLGERLPYKQNVGGSIPSAPTRNQAYPRNLDMLFLFDF